MHGDGSVAGMTRTRMALILTTTGLAALLGLSACGGAAGPAPAVTAATTDGGTDLAALADDAFTLEAVGLQAGLEPAPDPSAAAAAGGKATRAGGVRKLLRGNTLHGEMTLQRKKGVTTVLVQRGTVTAVDGAGLTVKSTDGFTATWTFGDKVRVVKDKKKLERGAVAVGAQVGVAGAKDGENGTARLIVLQ